MNIQNILSSIFENSETGFPENSYNKAIKHEEAISPYLLQALDEANESINDYKKINKVLASLFLLSAFKNKEGIIKLFKILSEIYIPDRESIVYIVAEHTPAFIVSMSRGCNKNEYKEVIQSTKDLIENKDANLFSRIAGIETLSVLVANKKYNRNEFISYLKNNFNEIIRKLYSYPLDKKTQLPIYTKPQVGSEEKEFNESLVYAACLIYPIELINEINQILSMNLVESTTEMYSFALENLGKGKTNCLKEILQNEHAILINNTEAIKKAIDFIYDPILFEELVESEGE